MPRWLVLILVAGVMNAAVSRGVVVDNQTSRPLARTLVTMRPVAGTAGTQLSTRTNVYGAFEFSHVAPGAWLVAASRRAFAPIQYGQKRWQSAGVPVVLADESTIQMTLRMPRFGAIAGTVVDENEVGLPGHQVVAYKNTRPPQMVTRATTDDRVMYRVWGLEPGSYIVLTTEQKDGDDMYLPTFAREGLRVHEARSIDVEIDRDTTDVSVRPMLGRLCVVGGRVQVYPPVAVRVTLVSDLGSQTVTSDINGGFQFQPVAPGVYEVYAHAGNQAAFTGLTVDREFVEARLQLGPMASVQVTVEDTQGRPVDFGLFQVKARRKDLSGEGPAAKLPIKDGVAVLTPGRWEFSLTPTAGYYVAQFAGPGGEGAARERPDGWNEIVASGGGQAVKFVLSPNPGMVRGTVTNGRDPAVGAPVYLEAFDEKMRRRLVDLRTAQTDLEGKFEFFGLPPGTYRILSTFEYQSPSAAEMDAAKAVLVKVEESRDVTQDLALFVLP